LRNLKPLERDSSTRKDIGVELLYAGRREEALAYAKEVAHFGELFISAITTFTEEGAGRAARMLYSAVVIHAEAGEQAQAEVYRQRICELFLQSKHLPEARSFALLCRGQSLALKGEWAQADEVLRQWVDVAESNVYVKNTAGPMASGYGLLALATARGGDTVWAKSYLRRSLASSSKDFCLQTRTREAELEREVRVLLGEEIGDKNAALTGATTSGDAEVEIQSGVVPIEAESGAISTVLARQGRARFMVGLAVGYLYLSNKFTDVPTLAISALLLVAVLALLRVRSAKSVQRARQAIAVNNTREVIVIAGSDRLTLRKIDPNDELNMYSANEIGVYHANEALIEACQACVSDNPFRATMYLDAAGKPAAIECFGYYSALSKSAILAD
jgi:tetratricopeptide (TPR) repeat protein